MENQELKKKLQRGNEQYDGNESEQELKNGEGICVFPFGNDGNTLAQNGKCCNEKKREIEIHH